MGGSSREDLAGKYFTRTAFWDWRTDDEADILDARGAVVASLDRSQTLVFEGADSGRTVARFIAWLRAEYPTPGALPDDLEAVVERALDQLVNQLGVVVLTDTPQHVPYYFDVPTSEQDPAEARRAMQEDGLIPRD